MDTHNILRGNGMGWKMEDALRKYCKPRERPDQSGERVFKNIKQKEIRWNEDQNSVTFQISLLNSCVALAVRGLSMYLKILM